MGYGRSPLRDFESYLRIVVGLDEEDFQLFSRNFFSTFIKYEIPHRIYSIKDFSEVVYAMGDPEMTLQVKNDDLRMKTKPILTRFGGIFKTLRIDEKPFFNTLLGFTPYWD